MTNAMAGGNVKPVLLFGDVFDAVPITTADTRCGFFGTVRVRSAAADNAPPSGRSSSPATTTATCRHRRERRRRHDSRRRRRARRAWLRARRLQDTATVVVSLEPARGRRVDRDRGRRQRDGGSANGTLKGTELTPAPADYKAVRSTLPKVLKFAAGKSTADFTIPITPDQAKESNETIVVKAIAASSGLTLNDDIGVVTIVDDDNHGARRAHRDRWRDRLWDPAPSATCGGVLHCLGTAVIPIQASSPVGVDTVISYTITNGSDVPGVFVGADRGERQDAR